jgi:hypothetical protein
MSNYNLTNMSSSSNLAEAFTAANGLTGNYLGILLLAIIFIVVYFNVNATLFNRKLMTASLVTTFIAPLMFWAGIITFSWMIYSPLIFFFCIIYEAFD